MRNFGHKDTHVRNHRRVILTKEGAHPQAVNCLLSGFQAVMQGLASGRCGIAGGLQCLIICLGVRRKAALCGRIVGRFAAVGRLWCCP